MFTVMGQKCFILFGENTKHNLLDQITVYKIK